MELEPGLLCVHPHPDDESIACGGVLAKYSSAGRRVKVVTCTRGEAGDNLAGIDLGGDDLITHRERELANALAELGVDDHEFLGYRDSGMVDTESNLHPDSFHLADLYEAAARLARIIRRFRPAVVVSDDERGTYGHPDHIKAYRVTERAVAMAADPWWETPDVGEPWQVAKRYVHAISETRVLMLHRELRSRDLDSPFGDIDESELEELPFGVPDEQITTRVDVREWLPRKRAAMAAHRSQISEDSFFLNTPSEIIEDAFGTEEFTLVRSEVPTNGDEDLFDGVPG
ncbi:MAG: N-acetyl-1-D-myo-inositol-2-amino-2-deoxy-alpha-D-glucopyranoside deacetylase [Nitriliruptorales bacterium]|nr:N-acetyl-1-D-myo-inositol-2-amino-2-deoxy-alpha-D-glucopyranoside deacetylase [Nitriliruptorales bacterium]